MVILTLALRAGPARTESPTDSERPHPNLLFIIVDTLRKDHLGCYGYERPTSPNLDAFARDAVRYESAFSASSFTPPSHASPR